MPWWLARAVGKVLGFLLFYIDQRDKKIAYLNFKIIYKDNPLSKKEQDRIIRRLTHNVVQLGIEYMKQGSVTAKNYHKYVEMNGYDNVVKAAEKGKGVIVVTLHMGNWEFLGGVAAKLGCNLGVIMNRQFNPYTDTWLRQIREKDGKIKCFYNEISDLMRIVRHLKNGGVIGTLVDQTYYFKPIFVPFFGMPSATADGPAKWHIKFGAPLLMAYAVRQPNGKYLLTYEEPVHFEPTGNDDKDVERVMTWINKQYERIILANPDQWFSLFHHRWERTKPEDFADIDDSPY